MMSMDGVKSMNNEIYEEHKTRMPSQKKQILSLLLDNGGGVTNADMSFISLRYGGIIHVLEREGWDIEKTNMGNGLVRYILHGDKPTKVVDNRTGLEIIRGEIEQHNGEITFSELLNIMKRNGLHIKHKPFGVKKRNAGVLHV